MMIAVTKHNFLTGRAYLAEEDMLGRKIMARFFPCVDEHYIDGAFVRLYDFESLNPLKTLKIGVVDAAYFFDAHCKTAVQNVESASC